jgi:hypothetical protein
VFVAGLPDWLKFFSTLLEKLIKLLYFISVIYLKVFCFADFVTS